MPAAMADRLTQFYQGVKKDEADQRRDGRKKVKEGKEPMSFELYEWLSRYFLAQGNLFAHLYITLCWNLLCRTSNVESLRLSHLVWDADSLGVYFAKTKSDQGICSLSLMLISQKLRWRAASRFSSFVCQPY